MPVSTSCVRGAFAALLFGVTLGGCGGGSSSSSPSSSNDLAVPGSGAADFTTGAFLDGPVGGLRYRLNGSDSTFETNAKGQFRYQPGDQVTFMIGGVTLGPVAPATVVTPAMIANGLPGSLSEREQAGINIARVMMTLDFDGDPENGITLWPALHRLAADLTLAPADWGSEDFDAMALAGFARQISVERGRGASLVSDDVARRHLATVARDLRDGRFDGDGGADGDRDGVNDVADRCPLVGGMMAFEGCPDQQSLNDDSDGDGVVNVDDNCPAVTNAEQGDLDGDGVGDVCDRDIDGDGLSNDAETRLGLDPRNVDSDRDTVADGDDAFPLSNQYSKDSDIDGIADDLDLCPLHDTGESADQQADVDGDRLGDACDNEDNRDSDGDGIQNHADDCPSTQNSDGLDAKGCADSDRAANDLDGDGVDNDADVCPATSRDSVADVDGQGCAPEQRDSDEDGIDDRADGCPGSASGEPVDSAGCDASQKDSDGDGVADSDDDFPSDPNESGDSDGDGIGDATDNCPDTRNAGQQDSDGDLIGDACDTQDNADTDGDGVENHLDNCPLVANAEQADQDGNNVGDACEADPLFDFFEANVHSSLTICRACHVPEGVADTDDGRTFQMAKQVSVRADFDQLYRDWTALGGGVLSNPILFKASNSRATDPHSGGRQWDVDSAPYNNMAQLLSCWEDPTQCDLIEQAQEEPLPLLGSARGGHIWFDYCEGVVDETGRRVLGQDGRAITQQQAAARSDDAMLPPDPRALVLPGVNQGDIFVPGDENAVAFNAFWKNCHIDEDGDGVPENLQATAEGVITEKAHPKTCGDLRLSIARGKVVMGVTQLPPPEMLPDCSLPENIASSPYCNTLGELIRPGSTFAAYDHDNAGAIAADAYNLLYKVWNSGAESRPENFDRIAAERYGMGWDSKVDNPYPLPGENPNDPSTYQDGSTRLDKGGSGQLPVGLIQLRDEVGNYSGNIGINCQACHGITIGDDFIWGGGGAMLDLGTFGADLEAVNAYYYEYLGDFDPNTDRPVGVGFGLDRVGVAGRTRGTNNAQFSNVTAAVGAVSSDDGGSLLFTEGDASGVVDVLTSGSTATGDTPAWWNVGRRTVKFVDAMAPADAVRVDMALFFPLFEVTPSVPAGCEPSSPDTWAEHCFSGGGDQFAGLLGFDTGPCDASAFDFANNDARADCFLHGWREFSERVGVDYSPSEECEAYLYQPLNPQAWMACGFRQSPFGEGMEESDWYRFFNAIFGVSSGGAEPGQPSFPNFSEQERQNQFEAAVRWVGENAQYADHWLMTLKSPAYPEALIDTGLAEVGAILFHEKDLWAGRENAADLVEMKTKGYAGNGSCASCHGAYSPRYVNDERYLDDPMLEGLASYVTPINAIGTDRVRFDTYMASSYDFESAQASGEIGGISEGSHQSGVNKANSEEYIFYAETEGLNPDGGNFAEGDCRAQNVTAQQRDHLGRERPLGYTAPPLYGVWATAPYLHNGSVPTIETLLNSAARPKVWRRKSKPNTLGEEYVMGYDSALSAYDHQAMGWQFEVLDCSSNVTTCSVNDMLMSAAKPVVTEVYGNVLLSWNVTTPPVLSNDDVEKRKIYNTTLHSQSNSGHAFTDVLTKTERQAIIEYLKTL
ncbi:hypothetical protein HCU74_05210 [Spongiibacter sp. KMU-166]|uniref:Cytochrome c domain-containing protein n=1 Tax=Spongiibacter thalassae TaxID=2721624 RepID=A0ABX1GCD9_9GAMM|nr:thrombospondin type 3 repeat-containing protein [Spongiibacter thalassae]NKI16817.1 hypothetical protein [Spongiibacter thalassae]